MITKEERDKYYSEKPVVSSMEDALQWFEMEMADGPCDVDCPQCMAYLLAIQALRIACIYSKEDWINTYLFEDESAKRISRAIQHYPVGLDDVANVVDILLPEIDRRSASGTTKELIEVLDKLAEGK